MIASQLSNELRSAHMGISTVPASIADVVELDELLSEPTPAAIEALAALDGDIILLGVGGKMGPTLARMAKRASQLAGVSRRVIGVSRFATPELEGQLRAWDVETLRCDLLDLKALAELPEVPNVLYLTGMKFGASGQQALTWATNSFLPGLVAVKYRGSRIVAFSTGNVYGLSAVSRGGSREEDSLNPAGEYAMSCVGRERILEHFSRAQRTKMSILRLNYATELRYGVLVDIARRVHSGQVVPLSMGYLNAIWQADASAMTLQALAHVSEPPLILNITGREILSVRRVAEEFGKRWGKSVQFEGVELEDSLLSEPSRAYQLFGPPRISADQMIAWIADWVERGGQLLSKPTRFEERAGRF